MDVVGIIGKSNSGKNGAIKYAIRFMLEQEETRIEYASCFRRKDKGQDSEKGFLLSYIDNSIKEGLKADKNIRIIVLQYKDKMIGFTTYGDSFADIKDAFERAKRVTDNNVDIFVCARHEKNHLKSEFNAIYKGEISVYKMISNKSESIESRIWDKDNEKKGEIILESVIKIINSKRLNP